MNEFKGTKGTRTVIEREEWFDVMDENGDRITSFCKDDERSKYDALIDAHAPEMLDFIKSIVEYYNNGLIDDIEHVAIRAELLYNKATSI